MKEFASLYEALDSSTRLGDKVAALAAYFRVADPADAAWALAFLVGNRPRRAVASTKMQLWAAEASGLPPWLFTECYDAVGDLAETIAAILPAPAGAASLGLAETVETQLLPLAGMAEEAQQEALLAVWAKLETQERFVFNKLLTGGFRVGVSKELVIRGLAEASGVPVATLAHRLMGTWTPSAEGFRALCAPAEEAGDPSRPYPFCLAHPLETDPAELGAVGDWQAEWKWDGIRAQVVRRAGQVFIWSRGEDLITERFPEVVAALEALPEGTVLDGELLGWRDGAPLPFAELQRRIGRKTLGPKLRAEVPVAFIAYDLMEFDGVDLRERPLRERRTRLEGLGVAVSPVVEASSWEELAARRAEARERGVEGLMLKARGSAYLGGRKKGAWWKWKVEPYTLDAVLVVAQRGSGRRAGLYTDYTFAVWDGETLVPFAKAYSGLTDAEFTEVDAFVRKHTRDRFGPVRTVDPELVFELGFEGIQASNRHKSGVAVRFPRILRWRRDKRPEEADRVETLRALAGISPKWTTLTEP